MICCGSSRATYDVSDHFLRFESKKCVQFSFGERLPGNIGSCLLINTCVVTGTRLQVTTQVPSCFPRSIYSIIKIHLQSFPPYHADAMPPLLLPNDVPLIKPPSR
jgi:hypothetical protein